MFLATLLGTAAFPAAAETLTLPQAVQVAMAHNSAVLAKEASLVAAESNFTKQRAQEFPTIVGTLENQQERTQNQSGEFAQFGITPVSKFSQNTAQVSSTWMFYNGSLNQILSEEQRRQVDSARADLRSSEASTTSNVSAGFFGLASRDASLALSEGNLHYQEELLDVAKAREKAGLVAGVDVLRADVSVQQAEASALTANAESENAREALAQLIGAPLDTAFAVPRELPQPPLPANPLEGLIAIAEANRPDLASSYASLEIARLSYSSINSDLLPAVSLNGSFGNQAVPTNFGPDATQVELTNQECASGILPPIDCIGYPFSFSRGSPGFWSVGITTTLNIPVIDYGTRALAHKAARAQIESAQQSYENTKSSVELDVRQSYRDAQTAMANVGFQKKASDLGVESARIAQLQYKNGLISFTDVTNAQQTALSAQNDLVTARVSYLNALVKLREAIGTYDPAAMVADL